MFQICREKMKVNKENYYGLIRIDNLEIDFSHILNHTIYLDMESYVSCNMFSDRDFIRGCPFLGGGICGRLDYLNRRVVHLKEFITFHP